MNENTLMRRINHMAKVKPSEFWKELDISLNINLKASRVLKSLNIQHLLNRLELAYCDLEVANETNFLTFGHGLLSKDTAICERRD